MNATSGDQHLKFPVTLSSKVESTISVAYTITPGTATFSSTAAGGGDYGGRVVGTVSFAAGTTLKTISVPIWPDGELVSDKNFTITLSNVSDPVVTIVRPSATGPVIVLV